MAQHNVRDYGAIGDGVTDDTDAIQRAINDAYSPLDSSGSLKFQNKRYLVKGTLLVPAGVNIENCDFHGGCIKIV